MSAGVQYRPTRLTVSRGALEGNARLLKSSLGGRARMMAVVKADAYGHGALEAARAFLAGGADALAVALVEEGVALRAQGVRAPILVLGGTTAQGARAAVDQHIALSLYDEDALCAMQKEAERLDTIAHAHIKVDTGMNRVGLCGMKALDSMIERLQKCPRVKCEGIFTHFAAADSDPEYTRRQNAAFIKAVSRVRGAGYRPVAHAAASEAMLSDETLWHDMVRPGIALYGAQVRHRLAGLTPAQRLTTRPVRLHWVEQGETVGYGRAFEARRRTLVCTLPIGYGDGYPRLLSDKAPALVQGARVPLIGRVCMDMVMLDVTDVPGVSMSDEVVLLGEMDGARVTPDELAILADTIPYEIMLGFGARVARAWVP